MEAANRDGAAGDNRSNGPAMITGSATTISGKHVRAFLLAIAAGLVLIFLSLRLVDIPVARFVHTLPWAQELRSPALGLPILVILSGVAIFAGALWVTIGHVPQKLQEVLIVASFSLTSSVCIDELLLKRFSAAKSRTYSCKPASMRSAGFKVDRWMRSLQAMQCRSSRWALCF